MNLAGFTPTTQQKAVYTKTESRLRRAVAAVAESLDADKVTRSQAFLRLLPSLHSATREALLTGKRVGMGGTAVLLAPAEEARAKALYDAQSARLRAWLLSSAPLTAPGGMGVGPRLDMYALSIYAAYETGLVLGLLQAASNEKGIALYQDDPLWLWERSHAPGLASCADCTAREAASRRTPYSLTQLLALGLPGSGKTKCLTRCRCRVRLIDAFGDALLRARAHHRAKPTAYQGVVDPKTLAATHGATVGPGKSPK